MPQFHALDPSVEVLGLSILGALSALQHLDPGPLEIPAFLRRFGLADLQPGAWYPQQPYLDCLRTLGEAWGDEALREIGRTVPATSRFPPEIHSLDRALRTLDIAYHLNHRGGEIGNYLYDPTGHREGILHCDNPYGCDIDQGILEGLGRRFNPPGTDFRLEHLEPGRCRKAGGSTCLYRIAW